MTLEHIALISIPLLIAFLWLCSHYGYLNRKNSMAATASYLLASLCVFLVSYTQRIDIPATADVLFLFGFVIIFLRLFFNIMKIQAGRKEFWLVAAFTLSASPLVFYLFVSLASLLF